jgi:hypothetical protein
MEIIPGISEGFPFCFIVISMLCLQSDTIGFPPVDKALRDWLVYETGGRRSFQKRLHGFICSLLMVTRTELETIASQKQGDYLPTAPHMRVCFNDRAKPHLNSPKSGVRTARPVPSTEGEVYMFSYT